MLEQDAESAWLELEPAEATDALPRGKGLRISQERRKRSS